MFNKKDKAMHRGLMKLLQDGTFPMKVREVPAFSEIFDWATNLPKEMEDRAVKVGEQAIEAKELAKKEEAKRKRRESRLKKKTKGK